MAQTTTTARVCLGCGADMNGERNTRKRCRACSPSRWESRVLTVSAGRTCLDCGADISGRSGTAKRCEPCAARAIKVRRAMRRCHPGGGETEPRSCPDCGVDISHRHHVAKRCESCARAAATCPPASPKLGRTCSACGGEVSDERHFNATRCSACSRPPRWTRTQATCLGCGADLLATPKRKRERRVRCEPCAAAWVAGYSRRKLTNPTTIAWRAANPWRFRSYVAKRKALKIGNRDSVGILESDWIRMLRRYQFMCAYCGSQPGALQMDHVVPLARGGRHAIGNVVPACPPCNGSKHAKTVTEWRLAQRRLVRPA